MRDLIIIGGGPAGFSAGVYAARKKLKTTIIAKEVGGQSIVSPEIQNWIGTKSISGADLGKSLEQHYLEYAGADSDLIKDELVEEVKKTEGGFSVRTNKQELESKTVLVASGANRRKLDIKGADIFEHKGLTYCATCDGPLFSGLDVAVIGGGNAGFETAAQLLAYTKSVTLLQRSDVFKADKITVDSVAKNEKATLLLNSEPIEVLGGQMVTGLKYKDTKTGEEKELAVQGIFVEIGAVPATDFLKECVTLNKFGQVEVDPKNQSTKCTGIWAAGDCTDALYHQNNIAAGDAIKAVEDIYMHLQKRS